MHAAFHVLFLASVPAAALAATQERDWTAGFAAGALLGPGEIGRDRNATGGHEQLIARWDHGLALLGAVRITGAVLGAELTMVKSARAVGVANEFGVDFPNHGEGPVLLGLAGVVQPLGFWRRLRRGAVRPFVSGGAGLLLVQVDLDNIKGQTLFVSPFRSIAGGVRVELPGRSGFGELRLARQHAWGNGPLRPLRVTTVTLGVGMRY